MGSKSFSKQHTGRATPAAIVVLAAVSFLWPTGAAGQDGALQTIRDDVREARRSSAPASSSGSSSGQSQPMSDPDSGDICSLFIPRVLLAGVAAGTAVTAPPYRSRSSVTAGCAPPTSPATLTRILRAT